MKKLVFVFAAIAAMCIYACGSTATTEEVTTDSIVNVVDSTCCQSVDSTQNVTE